MLVCCHLTKLSVMLAITQLHWASICRVSGAARNWMLCAFILIWFGFQRLQKLNLYFKIYIHQLATYFNETCLFYWAILFLAPCSLGVQEAQLLSDTEQPTWTWNFLFALWRKTKLALLGSDLCICWMLHPDREMIQEMMELAACTHSQLP